MELKWLPSSVNQEQIGRMFRWKIVKRGGGQLDENNWESETVGDFYNTPTDATWHGRTDGTPEEREFDVYAWLDANSNQQLDQGESHRKLSATIVKVDIERNGVTITDTISNVFVGQKIALKGVIRPIGIDISSKEWTITGTTIKTYTQALAKGGKTELAAEDLKNNEISYYWIDENGDALSKFNVVINGVACEGKAIFGVARPQATLKSVTTTNASPVEVSNPGFPGSALELHFGSLASRGITWTAEVTTPAGGAGKIAFTQIYNTDRHQILDDAGGTQQKRTSGGKFVLDDAGGIQYAGSINIGNSDKKTLQRDDTPGTSLTANIKKKSVIDSYKLYLMYRPDGADSIWVTLRVLTWSWSGSSTKAIPAGTWSLDPGSASSKDPGSDNSVTLPEWSDYFTNLIWVPE